LLLSPSAEEDFAEFRENSESQDSQLNQIHDAVVVGLAPTKFTYEHLNTAFRILSSSPPSSDGSSTIPLLATHRARYVRTSSGELSLGPGPFVSALEVGVGNGLKAECIGKPERAFFEVCLDDLGLERGYTNEEGRSIAVVGDDIDADLAGGAIEFGLWRVLGNDSFMVWREVTDHCPTVKTGKYREGDEFRTGVPPDEVYNSIGELVDALLAKDTN